MGRFVIMYTRDATEALRRIAERVRPGGIVAFHEWDARSATPAAHLPVLGRFQDLLARPSSAPVRGPTLARNSVGG